VRSKLDRWRETHSDRQEWGTLLLNPAIQRGIDVVRELGTSPMQVTASMEANAMQFAYQQGYMKCLEQILSLDEPPKTAKPLPEQFGYLKTQNPFQNKTQ
jgi:hypothetical protein